MKKVLIVNKSFETGGIQSSMVNMANELSKYYKVDLFVYNECGGMKERLSPKVNILPTSWRFKALDISLKQTIKTKDFFKALRKEILVGILVGGCLAIACYLLLLFEKEDFYAGFKIF